MTDDNSQFDAVEEDKKRQAELEERLRAYQLASQGVETPAPAAEDAAAEEDVAAEDLTAEEVIDKIEASDDADEVRSLGDDDRVTVQRAADKRLDDLEDDDDE